MKTFLPFLTLLLLVGPAFGQSAPPTAAPRAAAPAIAAAPKHLIAVKSLVAHLSLDRTHYEHGPGRIVWSDRPEAHVDCSGLVDGLLEHSYGYTPQQFKLWFDSHRPTAHRYYDEIARQNGFARVHKLSDAQPGDLLAVKYVVKSAEQTNTGHIMVLAGRPQRIAATSPLVAGTEQWSAPIYDSSSSPHGAGDTRRARDGAEHSGVGAGTLRIYTNAGGEVVGYTWTLNRKSKFRGSDEQPMVIGRLTPGFEPAAK